MKNELREIQKKIRTAAQRKQQEELQKKKQIKKSSEEYILEEKRRLEEEVKKKGPNYNVIFTIPLIVICFSLLTYLFVEVYKLYNSGNDVFQRPHLKDLDIKNAENFVSEILLKVKKKEKISKYLANVPKTWKERIEKELFEENQLLKLSSIYPDKLKTGNVPLLICKLINESNNTILHLFLLKESDKFFIFKVEKVKMEEKHEEKEK